MIGEDFKFDSKWLSDFSMIMYDPEESQSFVNRVIEKSEITSQRAEPNHFATTYSDTLLLNFLIIRDENECLTKEDMRLSGEDINFLRGWLESPKKPTELICPLEDEAYNVHYYGVFTNVQPFIVHGDCYGLYLEFTCNAPYGYSDEIKTSYRMENGVFEYIKKYYNNSAEKNEYLKPIITIFSTNEFVGETLTITNLSDGEQEMELTLPTGLSKLVIDCEKKMIKDENGNLVTLSAVGITTPDSSQYNYISTDSFLIYWLSLVPNANKLKFELSNNHTVKSIQVSARYIVKSGGF